MIMLLFNNNAYNTYNHILYLVGGNLIVYRVRVSEFTFAYDPTTPGNTNLYF